MYVRACSVAEASASFASWRWTAVLRATSQQRRVSTHPVTSSLQLWRHHTSSWSTVTPIGDDRRPRREQNRDEWMFLMRCL